MRKLAFLFIFALSTAQAYSPGAHKAMVKSSAEDYNFCVESLSLPLKKLSNGDVSKIIHGNLREDINPANKLKHWHFYHPTKDLGKGIMGWGFASFTERYKEADIKLKKRNALKALGTKTHYLQDVTNPAHVAPIYHGLGDGFDFYNFKADWPEKISKQKCQEIYSRATDFKKSGEKSTFSIVNRVTKATLEKMQEKVMVISQSHHGFYSWEEAFWSTKFGPTSKQANFGEYGFLGNTFGKPESAVDAATTARFAKERVSASIEATVELFMMEL